MEASIPSPVDPASSDDVTRALRAYLAARSDLTGVHVAEAPAPIGSGFDSFIYAFRIEAEAPDNRWLAPLVLRLQGKPAYAEKVAREAAVQAFLAAASYPTPALLAVEDERNAFGLPFMIMERVPGTTMLARMMSNPLRASGLLAGLGELHATLHRLPSAGWPLADGSEPVTMQRLARIRRGVAQHQLSGLADRLVWLERNAGAVLPETPVITHNDFHPLNVLVSGDGSLSVIDWSDAALGDRHFDVARTLTLFSFAYIVATSTLERLLLKAIRGFMRSRYLKGYRRALPLDERRLAYFEALQSLYALGQLCELQAEPAAEMTGAARRALRDLPGLIAEADVYVHRRIADARRLLPEA
jgi:aminoglycoside phosphotransferase (APT) family kinase protein